MRAALRIEDIKPKGAQWINDVSRILGEPSACKTRAWVAKVRVLPSGYVQREFLRPNAMDYTEANSVGSRGVYKCYWLQEQCYYEVSEPISWKNTDRYFCEVINGEIVRMTKEEVLEAQSA